MMATVGVVTSIGLAVLFESHQSHNLIGPVSQLRTGVGVLDAILYIFFAGWITSRVQTRA